MEAHLNPASLNFLNNTPEERDPLPNAAETAVPAGFDGYI
jgi:hypothetical protein